MKSAQSGLLPDGSESAIVKFGDSAAFMPMIKGILKQIRNSGELKSIMSQVIYKADKFRYWVDTTGEHLEHEPNWFGERGEKVGVYAIGTTKDGGVYIEVMSKAQVGAVRQVSRSKDGPWEGPFEDEMWRKTVLKRLAKRMPMSTDLEGLMKADDDLFMPPPAEIVRAAAEPAATTETPPPKPEGNKRASKTAKLVGQSVAQKTEAVATADEAQGEVEFATDAAKSPPPIKNHAPGAEQSPI